MRTDAPPDPPRPREGFVRTNGASLYCRDIGDGPPVIVLHGGPDFDHTYLLPELDRLANSCHLIYFDQRGRGRSADGVLPEDVTIASEIDDIDTIRGHFGLESVAVLGHSWGGVLALEYAAHHRGRVTHLILVDTAPASSDDASFLRDALRRQRTATELAMMETLSASAEFQRGDIGREAEYYRLHFRPAFYDTRHLDALVSRLRGHFTEADIVRAREIEHRLYAETWTSGAYDLLASLGAVHIPALVVHGADDFIPVAIATNVAAALPNAQLRVLPDCGHFPFLEAWDQFHDLIKDFLRND
jgi:proline iminopeptidase